MLRPLMFGWYTRLVSNLASFGRPEVITKEIPEPQIATADVTINEIVLAEVIDAPAETLPFTGFARTLWWLAAIAILASGMAMEISNRRRKAIL